jgi:hypothetical protein
MVGLLRLDHSRADVVVATSQTSGVAGPDRLEVDRRRKFRLTKVPTAIASEITTLLSDNSVDNVTLVSCRRSRSRLFRIHGSHRTKVDEAAMVEDGTVEDVMCA